jgi:hypothetical protein
MGARRLKGAYFFVAIPAPRHAFPSEDRLGHVGPRDREVVDDATTADARCFSAKRLGEKRLNTFVDPSAPPHGKEKRLGRTSIARACSGQARPAPRGNADPHDNANCRGPHGIRPPWRGNLY